VKRYRVDARPAFVCKCDPAAELDDAVVADVDAMVVVAAGTPDPEMVTGAEPAVHAVDGTG
jgi:hypothetical protein